ncbi:septum site-determining protein Ssd [Arthrobacter sp. SW1]|uniref:septum site-determining protein Ssd n=1 Tax=Arthrobacter sp. SW1 TaxID=1920889 RepID=UPI0009F38D43|nr:septum site-determining protein Ssd [Arthrobacter sp. SW1]
MNSQHIGETPRGWAAGSGPGLPAEDAGTRRGRRITRPGAVPEPQWLPADPVDVLLVTGNPRIRAEAERVIAALGAAMHAADTPEEALPLWDSAGAVLIGSDIHELPPRRRAPAILLGLDGEGDGLWQLAAGLGAERVTVLPEGAAWLAEHLSRTQAPDPGGMVLGLTGACGGAGSSTAAIWLAQEAAVQGVRTLLVDGDPRGGGLELSLAAEEHPGLRWPDLADARGSIDPEQFAGSLPAAGGFAFLSWPGKRDKAIQPDALAVASVMDAARRAFELVIVDIGRGAESLRGFAWDCDRILVLAPAQLRAAVAAARLLQDLPPVDAGLVVRGGKASALDGGIIADSLGLRLHAVLPELKGTTAAAESGRLLDIGKRRSVRRFAAPVLDLLQDDAA